MSSSVSYPSPEQLKGAVQGTLLYLCLYLFCFIPFQSGSKFYLLAQKRKEAKQKKDGRHHPVSFRAIKYYNSQDALALAGDRAVGNFLEFAIIYLPLYWIYAIFVDPSQSWNIAVAYSTSRLLYLLLWIFAPARIYFATGPSYLVLLYLLWHTCMQFAVA